MAIERKLPNKLRDKLVDALAKCDCMRTADKRVLVKKDLDDIGMWIPDGSTPMTDVIEIVETCSNIIDGIYRLREVVRRHEGSTFSFQDFSIALAEVELLVDRPGLEEGLKSLRPIAESLDLPHEEVARLLAVVLQQAPEKLPTYGAFLESARCSPAKGFEFLQRVLRHPSVESHAKAPSLRQWIDQQAPQFGVDPKSLKTRIEHESASNVYVVFKIAENQLVDNTFFVKAWSWRVPGEFSPVGFESIKDFEEPRKFEAIEALLRAAIGEVEERSEAAGLLVEIIAERKVFPRDISHWKVDVGESEGDLFVQFPVSLRWDKRFDRPPKHRRWKNKWEAVKKIHTQSGEYELCWLECETDCQPTEITNGWVDADRGVCLALGYKPPEISNRDDLLEAALNAGTPIVLWLQRTHNGETVTKDSFTELLGDASLIDLPRHIWNLRKQAYKDPDHPARRLTLLYDNADRVLPKPIGETR